MLTRPYRTRVDSDAWRGLGSTLSREGLARLAHCRTVFLAATELGRPICERLGFEVDGRYAIMRGPGGGVARCELIHCAARRQGVVLAAMWARFAIAEVLTLEVSFT